MVDSRSAYDEIKQIDSAVHLIKQTISHMTEQPQRQPQITMVDVQGTCHSETNPIGSETSLNRAFKTSGVFRYTEHKHLPADHPAEKPLSATDQTIVGFLKEQLDQLQSLKSELQAASKPSPGK